MRPTRSSTHDTVKVWILHQSEHTVEVLPLWLVKSDPAHGHHDTILPVLLDIAEEDGVVVADTGTILGIEAIQHVLDNKPTLAG